MLIRVIPKYIQVGSSFQDMGVITIFITSCIYEHNEIVFIMSLSKGYNM